MRLQLLSRMMPTTTMTFAEAGSYECQSAGCISAVYLQLWSQIVAGCRIDEYILLNLV